MKKTVTTILSLALAMILVSDLSSGVILAKGPSDNASDRGKERARHHKERQVGVLECLSPPGATGFVNFFDGPVDIMPPAVFPNEPPCLEYLNFLLNKRFHIEGIGTFIAANMLAERYTVVRIVTIRRED